MAEQPRGGSGSRTTSRITAAFAGWTRWRQIQELLRMSKPTDLVQGTLDLLILKTIALETMHGWGIALRIRQVSKDVLQVNQGALYPALHRLEQSGWIKAKWGESDNNRRAKFYSLTTAGRKYLQQEQANWQRLSDAIGLVLETT